MRIQNPVLMSKKPEATPPGAADQVYFPNQEGYSNRVLLPLATDRQRENLDRPEGRPRFEGLVSAASSQNVMCGIRPEFCRGRYCGPKLNFAHDGFQDGGPFKKQCGELNRQDAKSRQENAEREKALPFG